MGKWLAAIAKGLSYTAGPFKPLIDFVLRLYDGELAEKADKTLQQMILEQRDVSNEIIGILRKIRESDRILGEQFANGTKAIVQLIQNGKLKVNSPEQLEDMIKEALVENNLNEFWRNNFACVKTIEEECIKIYRYDIDRFTLSVEAGGFKPETLPHGATNEVIIRRCIRQTLTTPEYKPEIRAAIIGELSKAVSGSHLLKLAYQLLLIETNSLEGSHTL
jgi:hypothetical protein